MQELTLKYPAYGAKVRNITGTPMIFDFLRSRWLALTPEEWVRQHLLNYLVHVKRYPPALIAIEREIAMNDLRKRFDVVVYSREASPFLLIECKAPYIALRGEVIEQALRYNLTIRAPYVMITNGMTDHVFDRNGAEVELPEIAV